MLRSKVAIRFAVAGLMFSTAPRALGQTSSGGVPALKEELLIEIDRAKGKETLLELKAIDEEIIRKDADTKFDLAIIATKQDVSLTKVDLLNEADRAKAAESGLLGDFTLKLNNEAATRAAADAGLLSTIDGVSSAVTQEVTRATGVEATLTSKLEAEVSRASAAEQQLQKNIDNISLTPGPAGPQGPSGPEGPAGPAGPAGTGGTEAFTTPLDWNPVLVPAGTETMTVVRSLNLNPGSYVVLAKAVVINNTATGGAISCGLAINENNYWDDSVAYLFPGSQTAYLPGATQTLPLQMEVTTPAPFSITLKCMSFGTDIYVAQPKLVAIRVGSLTGQ